VLAGGILAPAAVSERIGALHGEDVAVRPEAGAAVRVVNDPGRVVHGDAGDGHRIVDHGHVILFGGLVDGVGRVDDGEDVVPAPERGHGEGGAGAGVGAQGPVGVRGDRLVAQEAVVGAAERVV